MEEIFRRHLEQCLAHGAVPRRIVQRQATPITVSAAPAPSPSLRASLDPPGREWERRSQDPARGGGGALGREGVAGWRGGGRSRGWTQGLGAAESLGGRGRCPWGPQGALGRKKPDAPLARPGSGRGARHPCGGSRSPGLAAAKVSQSSSGRPSFPGPGRGDDPRARTVSEGSGAPSPARPRASIAPNSDSQLGRCRGPAHARLPRRLLLLLLLPPLGSRIRAERAPGLAPGALIRLPVRRSAHADAGRPPGAPSPEGQLSAGPRGGARWAWPGAALDSGKFGSCTSLRGGGEAGRGAKEEDRGSALAAESALEKNVAELTVMDVYDIASLVGHEFERVIDQHGCEAIARLMPKVVRVLEILEVLVSRHHVAPELDELRLELDRLRLERMDRIEKERKHQKELELVEDVWRGEAQDLLSQIAQLQEENKQLMTNLSHKDVSFSEEEFQKHEGMSERERQVMKKLKEVVDKQRDEIRAKDRELGLKNEDVEALQQQQTRLMKINHDLRHRITVVEAQGKALIEQKVELEADLQTKEQEMGSLRVELGKLRERLQGELSQNGEEEPETEPGGEESVSEAEKMAMDLKDPNRPRFTLQELRDVLHERNELKSKVFLLQEELAYYKSEEIEEENRILQPPPIVHPRMSPQPESGIKRLFSFFSRDKKRLANTQRNVHIQESFGQWANSHRDDGYTEQGQEALQHL